MTRNTKPTGMHLSCSIQRNLSLNKGIRKQEGGEKNPNKKHYVGRKDVDADTQTNKSKEVLNPGHCGVLNTGLLCFDAAVAHMVFH